MENGTLMKLIERHSTELAALRSTMEEGFQSLNWKLDRLLKSLITLTTGR